MSKNCKIKEVPAFKTTDGKIFTSISDASIHQFDILWDEIFTDFIKDNLNHEIADVGHVVDIFVENKKELQKKINKLVFTVIVDF